MGLHAEVAKLRAEVAELKSRLQREVGDSATGSQAATPAAGVGACVWWPHSVTNCSIYGLNRLNALYVKSAVFSPDGLKIVSAGWDRLCVCGAR